MLRQWSIGSQIGSFRVIKETEIQISPKLTDIHMGHRNSLIHVG